MMLQEAQAASEAMARQQQAAEEREACIASSEASLQARSETLAFQQKHVEQHSEDLQVRAWIIWAI